MDSLNKIIFINGSINSGKSTVAKLLAKRLSNMAIIEPDVFHQMIESMPIDKAVPIILENTVSVVKNLLKNGFNVVVPYPLSQKNYEYIKKNLKEINDIYFFTLSPEKETALKNRGSRQLDDWEKERINHHYKIGIHNASFGEIIDNTNQTPEETVGTIMRKLKT